MESLTKRADDQLHLQRLRPKLPPIRGSDDDDECVRVRVRVSAETTAAIAQKEGDYRASESR